MYIKQNNRKKHINNSNSYCMPIDLQDNDNTNQIRALINTIPQIVDSELTERQKRVVDLILFKNLKQTQDAELLGISQPTVNRSYKSAIIKLQKYMFFCNECLKNYISIIDN